MNHNKNLRCLTVALLLAACPSPPRPMDTDNPPGGADMRMTDPDGDGGEEPGVFSGTAQAVFITDRGEERVPDDLHAMPIVGFVHGSAGEPRLYPAEVQSNGTFRIPNLPPGPVWIRQGGARFFLTSARTIDLSHYHMGRPDRVGATQRTPVSVKLSGMAPWQPDDDVQLVVTNLGFLESLLSSVDPPANDATTMDVMLDWKEFGGAWLIDSAKGDRLILAQMITQSAGGVSFVALGRSATVGGFQMRDGMETLLQATLTNSAPRLSMRLRWQRSRFVALASAIHPTARAFAQWATINVNPGGALRADFDEMPELMRVEQDGGSSDIDLGMVSFLNPYPTHWVVYGRFHHHFSVNYTVPGAPRAGTLLGSVFVSDAIDRLGAGAIGPAVGPVTNITINGMNAMNNPNGVGTSPTIRWDPPELGTANGYIVTLYRLERMPNAPVPSSARVATIYTAQTSFVMPHGLMTSGQLYALQIRAVMQPGVDLTRTPYMVPVQRAYADAITGVISP
ncbi:MAG: fibronectin type III domain-containing protein [Myxococcales bacterium]|nr:fibronectin type III domain-containing protein [Myxococcota bacterium]MDW8284157.1 fibronectin type III domain-containing protein [Myxococcales bacterium]